MKKYSSDLPSTIMLEPGKDQRIDQSKPHQEQVVKNGKFAITCIGWILQGGVIISATTILFGLVLLLLHPGSFSPQKLLVFPHTLIEVGAGVMALNPQAIITLGCLLLIATPIIRVTASIVLFALEHDKKYVIITLIVLAILLFSLFSGGNSSITIHPVDLQHIHFSVIVVLLIFVGSMLAGILGSLVGLGGGVLIVPLLTLAFGLPISFAIGASII